MKKKVVIGIIVAILVVLVLAYIGWATYRYVVICKMKKLEESVSSISNIYFEVNQTTDTTTTKIQTWKKDSVAKTNLDINNMSVTMWADSDNDEGLVLYGYSNQYRETDSSNSGVITSVPVQNNIIANNSAFLLAINPKVKISTEEYNGKECLYIKLGDKEAYTDKETGITLYTTYTTVSTTIDYNLTETETYHTVTVNVDYTIDTVTDSDVEKPDTSEYTLAE